MKQYQFSLKDECMKELPLYENPDEIKDLVNLDYYNYKKQSYEHQLKSLQSIPVPKKYLSSFVDGKIYNEDELIIFDSDKYFYGKCGHCGWAGSSDKMSGGGQIADTGDFSDAECPVCYSSNLLESEFDTSYLGLIAIPKQKVDDTDCIEIATDLYKEIQDININSSKGQLILMEYSLLISKLQKNYTITRKNNQ